MGTYYKKVSDMPEAMRQARKRRIKTKIQSRNFELKNLKDRFRMIVREPDAIHARTLFAKLSNEEQFDFVRQYYRGFKVDFRVTEIETLRLDPIRLVKAGFRLTVVPVIRAKKFWVDLAHYPQYPTPEQILHKIQHHLPTVKIL